MRLGIALGLPAMPPGDTLSLAAAAERAGFDTVGVGESGTDAFALLGAAATVTSSVRLLSSVATWVRPPVQTAASAATVDALSGGRFTLGLGTMPAEWNRAFYGIDPSQPVRRMREYAEVVRCALAAHSGGVCTYRGEVFTVEGYERPAPPLRERIPLHLAATRPGMARLAGAVADGVLYNLMHSAAWLREVLGAAVADGERGRDAPVERGALVICCVDADEERSLHAARRVLATYLPRSYLHDVAAFEGVDLSRARRHAAAGDLDAAAGAIPEDFVRGCCLIGSASACAAQLQRYRGVVDWVQLAPPRAQDADELTRWCEAALPLPALAPDAV